ncbi:MAG TPA: nitrilase-related carbon-nitrogen hydrolase, partial [Myxococcota bacterium]|nr:nitrilase-related carbon-nitrogen hydrolase [Myxococcota bacterium]
MRLALAQINTTIGDFAGNLRKIHGAIERARAERADVVILPELAVCGYPPGDLLERPSFLRDQTRALEELVPASRDVAILAGAVLPAPQGTPKRLSNAAVLL